MNKLVKCASLSAIFSMLLVSARGMAVSDFLTNSSSFIEAQELWQKAKDISSTDINGRWKRIAVYEHADCKNIMHGNAYDLAGIKNNDGSFFTLLFEGHQVKFLNVGMTGNTQGSYEINTSKTEFSSWAYDETTKDKDVTDQAYGSYSCRQIPGDKEKIICSVGSRLVNGASSDPVFKACSKLKTGLIVLFSKMD